MPSCDLSDIEKVPQIKAFIVMIEMRFDSLLVYSTDLIGLSWLHNHNLVKLKYPYGHAIIQFSTSAAI